ncbi:MAG: ABC transporter ATP-binding protein [Christensenellaceae bacterium]|nr:ABC transporter ATP-binding protein [Christensenellaceae bacterium]
MGFELEARGLCVRLGGKEILRPFSARFRGGKLYGILGQNGAAKTTLLRALAGLLPPSGGEVLLDGRRFEEYGGRERAKRLSYLPQDAPRPEGFSLWEMVAMGRTPYRRFWQREAPGERPAVEEALRRAGLEELAQREVRSLSGGEWQRALIARALCQGAEGLLLDEPASALDIAHAGRALSLLRGLCAEGHCAVLVLHDINLAAMLCDEIVLMKGGEMLDFGPPEGVLTKKSLETAYECALRAVRDEKTGRSLFFAEAIR